MRTILSLAIMAFGLGLPGASSAQEPSGGATSTAREYARYVVIKKTVPGIEHGCSETYSDDEGIPEQRLVCTGERHRATRLSTVMPLYRKYPPRLIDTALAAIGRGTLKGESSMTIGSSRHRVRWSASSADEIEIEETLVPVEKVATVFVRYAIITKNGGPNGYNFNEETSEEIDGVQEQRLVCAEPGFQSARFSDDTPPYSKHPPKLIDWARGQIAAGHLSGERELTENGITHHVRWSARDAHNLDIEETLAR